ncbi:hypothetical protein V6N13_094711 [Hibiscus sabdariffa]|uniref:Uncharacterized protein n=1 Tax=Hibiscus sabdariffa TaxID=183260 RepID=A0ABR2B8W1_9ROSI
MWIIQYGNKDCPVQLRNTYVSKVRVGKLSPYGIETLRQIIDVLDVQFVIKPDPSTGTVILKCCGSGMKKDNLMTCYGFAILMVCTDLEAIADREPNELLSSECLSGISELKPLRDDEEEHLHHLTIV